MNKTFSIEIRHDNEFPNYVLGETFLIHVVRKTREGKEFDITADSRLTIDSLDQENFYIIKGLQNGKIRVLCKKEGSGVIKASYKDEYGVFYTSIQFVCHSTFFVDNYLTYFLPEIDSTRISGNKKLKAIFDTIMEMLDILYAYNEDLRVINSFRYGKSKFLSQLAQNLGFERIDFLAFNSPYELPSNETFRELMGNILDLLSIRGTKLAYELFFGSLGYDISIKEFWYDENGDLIEINTEDEGSSTFYAYNEDGTPADQPQVARRDPRKNINVNSVFKNNKSNYVRISIDGSKNSSIAPEPSTFSPEKRMIISRYLEFLRPSHIQYIKETIPLSITSELLEEFGEDVNIGIIQQKLYSDEMYGIFSRDSEVYEQFTLGFVKNISDEFGVRNRYDLRRKYDSGIRYDYAAFLEENLGVTLL
jgi:hypothetical protein